MGPQKEGRGARHERPGLPTRSPAFLLPPTAPAADCGLPKGPKVKAYLAKQSPTSFTGPRVGLQTEVFLEL